MLCDDGRCIGLCSVPPEVIVLVFNTRPGVMSSPETTILLLHSSDLDPRPFICRLTGSESGGSASSTQWQIVNKYYTANVLIRPQTLLDQGDISAAGIPVIIYLLSDTVSLIYADQVLMGSRQDPCLRELRKSALPNRGI